MAKIIVADDDESMQLLIGRSLSQRGHQIFVANDGPQAVELVHCHTPDLLIIDANMTTMGGLEAIALLRSNGNRTPAILITAKSENDSIPVLDSHTHFLAKPFSPSRLLDFVNRTLLAQTSASSDK